MVEGTISVDRWDHWIGRFQRKIGRNGAGTKGWFLRMHVGFRRDTLCLSR